MWLCLIKTGCDSCSFFRDGCNSVPFSIEGSLAEYERSLVFCGIPCIYYWERNQPNFCSFKQQYWFCSQICNVGIAVGMRPLCVTRGGSAQDWGSEFKLMDGTPMASCCWQLVGRLDQARRWKPHFLPCGSLHVLLGFLTGDNWFPRANTPRTEGEGTGHFYDLVSEVTWSHMRSPFSIGWHSLRSLLGSKGREHKCGLLIGSSEIPEEDVV